MWLDPQIRGTVGKGEGRDVKSRHYSADKGPSTQSYGFSSSHVWM